MSRKPQLKDPAQIRLMRAAGLVVAETLRVLGAALRPGMTAAELDALAERTIRAHGAVPSFLGYHGFPASICLSVDAQVVHGIPRPETVLREGSVVSIDCGAVLAGWHGDAAVTLPVGDVDPAWLALSRVTEEALWAGLRSVVEGARLGAIGAAVEATVRPHGYGIVEGFTGHGIGTEMHQAPDVHNTAGERGHRLRLVSGHVLAIEPMVTLGSPDVVETPDGWTVVTRDGSPAAHWEHTVAVTETGPWVLTAFDGGAARLGALVSAEAAA